MVTDCAKNKRLAHFLVFIVLLHSSLSTCVSDTETTCVDHTENDREKRTIGLLFRSFVDAFQPQRQQAPQVYSYQPQRQTATKPQLPPPPQQSVKADLLASSKNLLQQKKNLFKPPSSQAPDTEIIPPAINPPVSPTRNPLSEILPQAAPFYGNNPTQAPPPNPLPTAPFNPFANLIPPPGHHPLSPLKAQILILPFQGQHSSGSPFAGFGLEPRLPTAAPPFNYQAEIYLHPPAGGVYPAANHYPIQYSPSNGWHDADEILSRGMHTSIRKDEKEDVGVINLTKSKNVSSTTYNTNIESPEVGTKHPENTTPKPENKKPENKENEIEGHRRDSNYQDEKQHHLSQSLFLPDFHHNEFFNAENFGNHHGGMEGNFLVAPFGIQHFGFEYPVDEAYKKHIPEGLQNIQVLHQRNYNTQEGERKKETNGASVAPHGETGHVRFIHDYVPQREDNRKFEEDHYQQKQHQQHSPYQYQDEEDEHNQNNIHHQEMQQPHYMHHKENSQNENHQLPAKYGRVPDSLLEYQYAVPPDASNPHQAPPVYDSHMYPTDQDAAYMDGQNYKRYNSEERYITKNCNNCKIK